MGILWTILFGFIAGILAKFLVPGDPNLRASSPRPFWESLEPSSRLTLVRL
jgi:hypothetical protein